MSFCWDTNHTFQIQIFLVKQVSKYVNKFRDSVEKREATSVFVQGLLFRSATENSYSTPVLLYISLMKILKTSFY